jgi:hypothetical protein
MKLVVNRYLREDCVRKGGDTMQLSIVVKSGKYCKMRDGVSRR